MSFLDYPSLKSLPEKNTKRSLPLSDISNQQPKKIPKTNASNCVTTSSGICSENILKGAPSAWSLPPTSSAALPNVGAPPAMPRYCGPTTTAMRDTLSASPDSDDNKENFKTRPAETPINLLCCEEETLQRSPAVSSPFANLNLEGDSPDTTTTTTTSTAPTIAISGPIQPQQPTTIMQLHPTASLPNTTTTTTTSMAGFRSSSCQCVPSTGYICWSCSANKAEKTELPSSRYFYKPSYLNNSVNNSSNSASSSSYMLNNSNTKLLKTSSELMPPPLPPASVPSLNLGLANGVGQGPSSITFSSFLHKDIIDIDANRLGSPQHCTEHVNDIYATLKENELKYLPKKDYLETVQNEITEEMRAILFDWLVEVAEEYQLSSETLFLSKNFVDRYLSLTLVSKALLQLVGIACMLIAAKYEEVVTPSIEEFACICDRTYSRDEIVEMEMRVLTILDYKLTASSENIFLRRYQRAAAANITNRHSLNTFVMLSHFITELTLPEYSFVGTRPSLIAASAIALSLLISKFDPWTPTLQHYANLKWCDSEFQACLNKLGLLLLKTTSPSFYSSDTHLNAIPFKYSQNKYLRISEYPIHKILNTTSLLTLIDLD